MKFASSACNTAQLLSVYTSERYLLLGSLTLIIFFNYSAILLLSLKRLPRQKVKCLWLNRLARVLLSSICALNTHATVA